MSEITIAIQDYRIIKQAVLKLKPGLTMIVATNCSGKSTAIKAVRTLLDGTYGEAINVRHGKEGYAIAVRVDDTKVRISRRGKDSFLKFQDEQEVSKLGRGSLSKLEPRFPLKRVDYLDSSFYPNFSFQNSVPLFDDISVFDLFSSMFQDVARVAQRVDSLRKDTMNLSRNVQDLEANVGYQTAETSKTEQVWQKFQETYPHLDSDFSQAESSLQLETQISQLRQQQAILAPQFDYLEMQRASESLMKAQELFPLYDRVQAVKPRVERFKQLEAVQATLAKPVSFDANLIQKGYRVSSLSDQATEIKTRLSYVPDLALIQKGLSYKNKEEELTRVNLDLASVKEEHDRLFDQVKKEGCPFALSGVCPKM